MRFGPFELDEINGELRRDGTPVKLPPRQFKLLALLARNSSQVVNREEIQRDLWGTDTYVDFQRNLNVCIAQIRAALEDDSESPRFIQTVPRRGYRFVAAVENGAPPVAAPAQARSRNLAGWIAAAACMVAAAFFALRPAPPVTPRIAMLPFVATTHDEQDQRFADVLTSEVIGTLGMQGSRLSVIGRSSVERYRGNATGAAKELQADYVVTGSVHARKGDTWVASVDVERSSDHVEVWHETIERDSPATFQLQQEIAAHVSAGVLHTLFPEAAAVARPTHLVSDAAYQAYLGGLTLQRQGSFESLARSATLLRDAVDKAPDFAAAHAALAETYVSMGRSGAAPASAFAEATEQAQAALALDASNPDAHNALANGLFWHDWDWPSAEREFRAAIAANPSFAAAYHDYAFFLVAMGRPDAALAELRTAVALDPVSVRVNMDAGWLLLQAHRFNEAIAQAQRAQKLQPGLREADACIARARLYQGQPGEAVPKQASHDPYMNAAFQSLRGDRDSALKSLQTALAARHPMMVMLQSEPSFDRMRSAPEFRAIVAQMRFPN